MDSNKGLYIKKGLNGSTKYLTSWKRVKLKRRESKPGMKTRAACLE